MTAMRELTGERRKQARVQAMTYLVAGLGMMVFLMLYLGPRAQAERLAGRAAQLTSSAAPAPAAEPATPPATEPAATPAVEPPAVEPPAVEPPAVELPAAEPSAAEPPAAPAAEPAVAPATEPAAEPAPPPAAEPAPAPPPPATSKPAAPPPAPLLVTHFSTGKAELSNAQVQQVQRAARRLAADPSLSAIVRGHADRRGSEGENAPLSAARAQMVAKALGALGIAAERIELDGAGSQTPLDAADTPAAYARNRRVEIIFHRKEAP